HQAIIFLVAHPRKAGLQEFRNDDISGSGHIADLASVIIRYDETRKPDDPGDRLLQVTKNRLTGRVDYTGTPLWYEESSKRISDTQGKFDWHYKWEKMNLDALDGFEEDFDDDSELPFGENGEDL
ncbi:MAG: hypothetical protein Q4C03_08195, partial [bacterium]|nr:hypothetical protein [bacterium]